jgi:hypothetical protein
MHRKHNEAHDENNVNKTARGVKRKKPKQPKHNQNCSDYSQHFVFPFSGKSAPADGRALR